jgi:hypothetical protein
MFRQLIGIVLVVFKKKNYLKIYWINNFLFLKIYFHINTLNNMKIKKISFKKKISIFFKSVFKTQK